jgi:hypothetical protein
MGIGTILSRDIFHIFLLLFYSFRWMMNILRIVWEWLTEYHGNFLHIVRNIFHIFLLIFYSHNFVKNVAVSLLWQF